MKKFLITFIAFILCFALVACGGTECTHVNNDCDGKCDSCGADFGSAECKDENNDGACDTCGKTLEAAIPAGTAPLVQNGVANFKIVIGSDAMTARTQIDDLVEKLNARLEGDDIVVATEKDSVAQDIEIIFGTVTSRGAQYTLDKYSYGEKGYGIELVGNKIIVIGGSDDALVSAIKDLERDVFKIAKAVTPITEVTVTESIHKPQTGYKTESVTIDGVDLDSFVFAIDNSSEANSLAKAYQKQIYSKIGDYLEIVKISKLEEGQRAIIISIIEKGSDKSIEEGFNAYISNGNLVIECEFANKLEEVAGGIFDKEILNNKKNIAIPATYTYKTNIRIITYEQFGAKGDGTTDDFAAIKDTHDYANQYGHVVHATAGKTYYIGNKTEGKSAIIKTDTYWNGATFIFDDSHILTHSSDNCKDCLVRSASIFSVESDRKSVDVAAAVRAALPILSSFDGEGTQKFENWPLNYTSLVYLNSNERKVFIRQGANADSGDSLSEVILVHPDGTIDPSTPITWNYSSISYATAYSADDTPIVIDGGGATVETIANRPENNDYIQYARNIATYRSNVTICNFEHIVHEEQEFRAPYAGIIYTSRCHNVTYENIVLQAARRKFVAQNNQQGTYEIGGYSANAIKFINVNASNFFGTGADYDYRKYGELNKAGEIGNRGLMGTNYCRNFHFKECRLVNFDSHKGMGNLTIEDCELQSILIMGAGNVVVRNTVMYIDSSQSVLNYRSDYGASYRGDITLDGIELKYSNTMFEGNQSIRACLLKLTYETNNDYDTVRDPITGKQVPGEGSTNYMCTNLYVSNIKVTKYEKVRYIEKNERGFNDIEERILTATEEVYVINKKVAEAHQGYDISQFKAKGGVSDLNRYIPPQNIVIQNCSATLVLPTSTTFENNTKITVDGKEYEYK